MMRKATISAAKILLYLVLVGVTVAGMVEFVLPQMGYPSGSKLPFIVLGAVNFVAMFVPAVLLTLIMDRKSPMAMGLQGRGSVADFLTGGVVGGFIFLCALTAAVFGGWASIDMSFAGFSMMAMALGAIGTTLAAAGEEVMLRGYVLQELMGKFSTAASVIASSLFFTALHANALIGNEMAAIGALNIFLASILLSLAYLATRTLWLPIGIHAGWNFVQGPLLGINVSGNDLGTGWDPVTLSGPPMMTGGTFGFEGSLLGIIGPATGIAMVVLMRRRQSGRAGVPPALR
ncbi:MAG: CPBP family intramembrane metalloprotease [Alphaproteobacteria bacterium]|nr:CPBP family intramembrane metalloprotease [Alphaproteobacteria bacterium]